MDIINGGFSDATFDSRRVFLGVFEHFGTFKCFIMFYPPSSHGFYVFIRDPWTPQGSAAYRDQPVGWVKTLPLGPRQPKIIQKQLDVKQQSPSHPEISQATLTHRHAVNPGLLPRSHRPAGCPDTGDTGDHDPMLLAGSDGGDSAKHGQRYIYFYTIPDHLYGYKPSISTAL